MPCTCYCALEGSRLLLSDERNKKHLIDLVLKAMAVNQWTVCAFCLTDDSVYLIANVSERLELKLEMQIVVRRFWRCFEGFQDESRRLEVMEPETVETTEELVRRCRAIHRLPIVHQFASRLGDYWWSSYNTYLQNYEWEAVDCSTVLNWFSDDPEEALRKLKRFHAIKETNSNLFLKKR